MSYRADHTPWTKPQRPTVSPPLDTGHSGGENGKWEEVGGGGDWGRAEETVDTAVSADLDDSVSFYAAQSQEVRGRGIRRTY